MIQDPVAVNILLKTNSYLSCLGLVDLSQVHEILVDLGIFVKNSHLIFAMQVITSFCQLLKFFSIPELLQSLLFQALPQALQCTHLCAAPETSNKDISSNLEYLDFHLTLQIFLF